MGVAGRAPGALAGGAPRRGILGHDLVKAFTRADVTEIIANGGGERPSPAFEVTNVGMQEIVAKTVGSEAPLESADPPCDPLVRGHAVA